MWDVISSEVAAKVVRRIKSPDEAAKKLCSMARSLRKQYAKRQDDITAIVVIINLMTDDEKKRRSSWMGSPKDLFHKMKIGRGKSSSARSPDTEEGMLAKSLPSKGLFFDMSNPKLEFSIHKGV